ncbi:hypothetical protein [Saccharopolyspora griseoalba]|uniref:Zinc finger protein n=1 Tax=Saccharopolyspora griseoalba TaxID=1431848 RepID=A0ABW2LS49_9PSEU
MTSTRTARHFWLPVANGNQRGGVRHAFRGGRWDGQPADVAVCGEHVALAHPSELDWISFPTCGTCSETLKGEA